MAKKQTNRKTEAQKAKEVAAVIADNIAQEVAKDGIKALPTGARVAMAKGLQEKHYSVRRIARVLDVDMTTAHRYIHSELEDQYKQYTNAIKYHMEDVNDALKYKTANAISAKLQDTDDVSVKDLTALYKVTNEVSNQRMSSGLNTGTTVQILNVHPALNRKPSDK